MINPSDFIRYPAAKNAKKHAARRYINTKTGQEISRWAMQQLQHGGMSPKEVAKIRKVAQIKTRASKSLEGYSRFVKTYKAKTAAKLGIKFKDVKVRGNSPEAVAFRENVRALNKFNAREKKKGIKPHMRTPAQEHELKTILENLNLRDPEWTEPPGQSPTPE